MNFTLKSLSFLSFIKLKSLDEIEENLRSERNLILKKKKEKNHYG